MRFDPLMLALAVILLWTPAMVFVRRGQREKLRNPIRNRAATIGRMLLTALNWFDFARAAGGVWLLRHHGLTVEPGVAGVGTMVLGLQVAIILAGLLLQVLWHDEELIVLGPAFYLAGATVALIAWPVAVFGGVLGVTLAQMFGRLHWLFGLVPVLLAVFAYFFGGLGLPLAAAAALWLLPLLVEMSTDTPIAFVHRKSSLDKLRVPRSRV